MEAYKAFEECCQEKLNFARLTFAKGMEDTQKKVKHHLDIDLDFLYEDEFGDEVPTKGMPAPEPKAIGTREVLGDLPI